MNFTLQALSPLDGRYKRHTKALSPYFSEYGLISYRIKIEIEYFLAICDSGIPNLKKVNKSHKNRLRELINNISEEDALRVKSIEKITNHDVKAVEYFLKEEFSKIGLEEFSEFIHFGLTSQDINNTAIPLSLKEFHDQQFLPAIIELIEILQNQAKEWESIPMLSRTHGQPASPTRLGKEWQVFITRLESQLKLLQNIPFSAKFGGATGSFNAHFVAFPNINWHEFSNKFCLQFGLNRSYPTTQIEHYDNLAAYFDGVKRIHTILIDFSRDLWTYISMDYFKQKIVEGEIGSSAMPHKVNPIDFENAEGNLGMANCLFDYMSSKLPISRLQRDLTDSTVLRNIGVPFGHSFTALSSIKKGLSKLIVNKEKIGKDLESNWAVVAEGIQTILRREGFSNPYEMLKELTRKNEKITASSMKDFINNLDVDNNVKAELLQITPQNYTGL